MAQKEDRVQSTILLNSRQAVNELGKLEMQAKEVKNELKGMKRGTDEFNKTSEKLKKAELRIKQLRKELGLSGMTLGQLTRMQRQLRGELINTATKGTVAYRRLKQEYKAVSAEIRKQRKELRGGPSFGARLSKSLGKAGAIGAALAGIALTIQGLLQGLSATIKGMSDLSDSIADVQKTTGLTRSEVDKLNQSFKKLDTRTSRKQLLKLAQIAGKLGVQGRKNIEGFVKSADKLVVALGEDLGGDAEETIKQVGKLVDLFKVKEKFGLEDGLNKVGSAINSLGAASSASEAFLVDFTKRLGGIAPNANISISNVLGLAATLDQLGQTSEVSSTSMSQLLVSLGQDMPAFAKLAGLEVSEFSRLLEEDANEALIKVVEGAKSTKNGLAGMAETLNSLGVDGARAASVVGVLSNNVDLLREQQALANKEFEEGTSILQEFNTKNNNFAAKIEKLQKVLYAMFVNSTLMKGIEQFVDSLNKMLETTETTEQAIRRETNEMNALFTVIKDANTQTDIRKKAIEKLNKVYGKYLPKLITEKTSLKDIEEAQRLANIQLTKSIIIRKEKENLEKAALEGAEKMKKIMQELQDIEAKLLENTYDIDEKLPLEIEKEKLALRRAHLKEAIETRKKENIELGKRKRVLNEIAIAIKEGFLLDIVKGETDGLLKAFGLERDRPVEPEIITPEIDPDPDPDPDPKPNDELSRKFAEFNEEMERFMQERNARSLDANEKDLIAHSTHIENLMHATKTFHEKGLISVKDHDAIMKELRRALEDEDYNFDIASMDKRLKQWQENYDKRVALERRFKDFKSEIELETMTEQEQEIAQENERFSNQLEKLEEFKINQILLEEEYKRLLEELEQQHKDAIHKINQEAAKKEADLDKKRRIEKLQQQAKLYSELSGLLGSMNELMGSETHKSASFQKQVAVFQLALDTASAISSGIANASKYSANPILLAANIAGMIATIASSMAKARKLLSAEAPKPPNFNDSFAVGGFTGQGFGRPDKTGFKPAGVVHEGEYVVPKWLLEGNQFVMDQVAVIESLRTRRTSSFANGGAATPEQTFIQSAPNSQATAKDEFMMQMLMKLDQMNEHLERLNDKKFMAVFDHETVEEVDRYRDRVAQSEADSNI